MNITFGSLSSAPHRACMQRGRASQPAFSGTHRYNKEDKKDFPSLDDRPDRNEIIGKDEIIGLIIDLETLSQEEVFNKYFCDSDKKSNCVTGSTA